MIPTLILILIALVQSGFSYLRAPRDGRVRGRGGRLYYNQPSVQLNAAGEAELLRLIDELRARAKENRQ